MAFTKYQRVEKADVQPVKKESAIVQGRTLSMCRDCRENSLDCNCRTK